MSHNVTDETEVSARLAGVRLLDAERTMLQQMQTIAVRSGGQLLLRNNVVPSVECELSDYLQFRELVISAIESRLTTIEQRVLAGISEGISGRNGE